ncbi:hypothetical protein PENSPDRAFT_686592 [Peniophora sp. CONT]|nr:hypothetical protein PENSPDRAFT_686592 [Peniophora sp. CONT]
MLQAIGGLLVLASHKRLAGISTGIKSSKLPAFLLWSWWFLSPESGFQSDNRALDSFVHVHMDSTPSEQRVWMEDIIINDIGAENVLSKLVNSIMENESLVGDILGNSLLALDEIASWKHPAMARAASRVPITSTLAHALKNKDGSARPYLVERQHDSTLTHLHFKIWVSCAHLLKTVASTLASGTCEPKMVSGDDVYSIYNHGLTLALNTLRVNKETFALYKGFYSASLQCWIDHLHRYKSDKSTFPATVVQALRKAASRSWYGILLELRKITNAPEYTRPLINDWLAFGTALGFDEEKKRKEYNAMLAHICSWTFCPYHLSPAEEAFKHCKGCGVAHYCSSECQMSDWKKGGHKAACRRLKG